MVAVFKGPREPVSMYGVLVKPEPRKPMDYLNRQMDTGGGRSAMKQQIIFDDARKAILTHGANRVRVMVTPNTVVPADLKGVAVVVADLKYCAVQLRYPTGGSSD